MFSVNDQMHDEPSEILPESLYLGGYEAANDTALLERLRITHIVQLGSASEIVDLYRADTVKFIVHRIQIEDSVRAHMTPALLDFAVDFIGRALDHGSRVIGESRMVERSGTDH